MIRLTLFPGGISTGRPTERAFTRSWSQEFVRQQSGVPSSRPTPGELPPRFLRLAG